MARLPFDTDRPETRPFIFKERDWNSTPDLRVSRELRPFLDEVAMLTANELSANANENVLSTFTYNMMSVNDFLNDDFKKLVDFVCDSMELRLDVGETRDIDEDINRTITNAVLMYSCGLIHDFPELLDEVEDAHGAGSCRSVQGNASKYEKVRDQIEDMNSSDRSSRGSDARNRGRTDDRSRSDRYSRNDRSRDRSGSERGSRNGDDRGYRGRRGREERVLTGREMNTEDLGDPSNDFDTSDPNYVPDRSDIRRGRHTRQTTRQEEIQPTGERYGYVAEEPAQDTRRVMRPSADFFEDFDMQPSSPPPPPPKPANPPAPPSLPAEMQAIVDRHSLGRSEHDKNVFDGPFGPMPIFKRIKETEMDINQHSAIYPEGSVHGDALMQEAAKTLSLEAAVLGTHITSEQIEGSVTTTENLRTFNSLGSLLTSISDDMVLRSVGESGDNTDGVRKIYHSYAVVTNAMFGFRQLKDLQKNLRECETLRDICGVLQRTRKTINTHAPASAAFATDMRAAVSRFDRIITKEINTFCRVILKISNGNAISSFIENFDALIETVHTKCDENINNALMVFLSGLNASIMESLAPKLGLEKILTEESTEPDEVEDIGMVMLPLSYLVTHLPFTLGELGVKTAGAAVIGNNDISDFVRAAIDVSKIENPDFSSPIRIVMTRDMEAFRVYTYPGRRNSMVLLPLDFV